MQVVRLHDMPDGYEVSIRTPVTPPRWEDFNEVRAAGLQRDVPALCLHQASDKRSRAHLSDSAIFNQGRMIACEFRNCINALFECRS